MIPITELRAAVPIGITVYDLPVWKTWVFAVMGNLAPTIVLLLVMPYVHDWVIKQKFLGGILQKKLQDAENKFSGNYAKYGAIALVVFVGIPLPLTGAWTGSLAAFIFRIPFKKAFPLIFLGICMSATLVTLITQFGKGAIGWFL